MWPILQELFQSKKGEKSYVLGGAAGLLLFIMVAFFGLAAANRYAFQSEQFAAVVATVLANLVNTDRSSYSLKGLTSSPQLKEAAQLKANDMAQKGYFAHVAPDGTDSWHWFRKAGYVFAYAGENLAVDFSDSKDVERAWMNSPTHRSNILNGRYTEIGIATAEGFYQGRPTTFVVQMFGAPAKKQVSSALAPKSTPSQPAKTTAQPAGPVLGESIVAEEASASVAERLLASPKTTLQYAYYLLGLIILIILGVVTRFEFERHHQKHFVAAALLFLGMFLLFTVASLVLFPAPTLASIL